MAKVEKESDSNDKLSGSSKKKKRVELDPIPTVQPPLLFKVEKVLGVHVCPYSNRAFMKEFMEKYDFKPSQVKLDLLTDKSKGNQAAQVAQVQKGQASKLTSIDRYLKVKRYLEKRQKRMWKKKVDYACRKDVADKRLRIKGRFVRQSDLQDN